MLGRLLGIGVLNLKAVSSSSKLWLNFVAANPAEWNSVGPLNGYSLTLERQLTIGLGAGIVGERSHRIRSVFGSICGYHNVLPRTRGRGVP